MSVHGPGCSGIDFENWKGVPNPDATNIPFSDLLPALRTRIVYDMVPDEKIQEWAEKMGVIPSSDNGYDVEQAASVIRRNALMPLITALTATSALASDIGHRATLISLGETFPEPDGDVATLLEPVDEQHVRLTIASVMAVVSNLIDLGILTYGRALRQ